MNGDSGPEDTARGGQNGDTGTDIWGARNSLRRHAGLDKIQGDSEVTPLLASGSSASGSNGQGDGDGNGDAPQWEGHADFEGLNWRHKPSMFWLLPPFFFFATAVGGIMVPKLNLLLSLVCREYFLEKSSSNPNLIFMPVVLGSSNPQCRIPEVQALASKFTLYITMTTGILSAIMSPRIGAWSDRYGRLKLLTITSAGALIGEVITIIVATYPDRFHYNWILFGSVFDGLCGSFTTGMALTHAYASDCTPPPKRAVAFGYFHACLFAGIAIGPLIAAVLVKLTDSIITPFYFALSIHAFFITFILLVVPESLTKKRQERAQARHFVESGRFVNADGEVGNFDNETGQVGLLAFGRKANILEPLKILWPTGPGTSNKLRGNLILLSTVDTIVFGVAMGAVTVVVYYLGFQFGWETPEISVFTSVVNIFRVSALVIALPLLNYLVRTRRANRERRESGFAVPQPNSGSDSLDLAIIRVAVVCEIIGFAGYAAARTPALFVLSGIIASLGGVGSPTLQSALTKHVPHDRVGQLLGATGLLHALARVVCPLIFNLIYATTVGTFPQAVFVVLTGCFVAASVCTWFIRPNVYLEDPITINTQPPRVNLDPDILVDEEITNI
ncbi:major facilitator superfamily domain-containing protein [Leptodontidium sp. 2 PMI_412]|nr:major facilitator superfamily domain-containing protein [Leptodontidium sp. MPI-SDFR-AT-0119]KAH9209505.1 major facilitator superfamily domain-containing protein [Leptodontidium sp. 2 PMI_412]